MPSRRYVERPCRNSVRSAPEALELIVSRLQFSATARKHGAEILAVKRNGRIDLSAATHIIANSIDFEDFAEATAMMIPVVNSRWLLHSLNRKRQAQLRPFSPDPRMIFSHVNLTCADIPNSDKDAIIGATLALGGMESKDLSRLTTHICALSMDHEKCQQAKAKNLNCKIVLPHWFDECFKLGKRIDEGPYLLPDPEVLRVDSADEVRIPPSQHLEGATTTRPDAPPLAPDARGKLTVFNRKKVMISWDLAISKRFRPIVTQLIEDGGGGVVDDVEACDMFICQYRDGDQYVRAAQSGKDVGNLAWLFYLITHNEWCSPLRRLLHYPVPRNGVPGFQDYKITLSNYGGEARIYLENLITATGATFTKTMKAENTHLITARSSSEKCEAAKDWNINMINHLWIEESYARCEMQSLTNPRYTTFPPRTNLGEVIGQTSFDEERLRENFYPGDEDSYAGDETSFAGGENPPAGDENPYAGDEMPTPAVKRKRKAGATAGAAPHIDVLRDDTDMVEESSRSFGASTNARASRDYATPARGRHVRSGKENDTPSMMSSGSRSAKERATMKLHRLAPDIALYEKEKKRTSKDGHAPWGGKRAATQYEKERAAAKGASSAAEAADDDDDDDDEGVRRLAKKHKPSLPAVETRIILTGFTRWIGNQTKEDSERVSCHPDGTMYSLRANTTAAETAEPGYPDRPGGPALRLPGRARGGAYDQVPDDDSAGRRGDQLQVHRRRPRGQRAAGPGAVPAPRRQGRGGRQEVRQAGTDQQGKAAVERAHLLHRGRQERRGLLQGHRPGQRRHLQGVPGAQRHHHQADHGRGGRRRGARARLPADGQLAAGARPVAQVREDGARGQHGTARGPDRLAARGRPEAGGRLRRPVRGTALACLG